MSEIKVNKITPRAACGTVTLGDSGDTFTIPSGATITNAGTASGFGRTGTVDWITTPKVTGDSPVTGVTGKGYFLNTTAGAITINLPAGSAGDIISMADYAATWQTNNVTVSPNGSDKIGSLNEDATLETEGQSVTFVFVDSTQGWINTMDSTSNVRGTPPFVAATVSGVGNTLATAPCCADTKIATFLGPGTFCVSAVSGCATKNTVSYMVVAGGGAANPPSNPMGGGGAGGFREYESPSTPYTSSPLDGGPTGAGSGTAVILTASPYAITVGGGGTPSPTAPGSKGNNSVFDTITSTGGGSAGGPNSGGGSANPGGSGGGAGGAAAPNTGGDGDTPSVTPAQGTNGGANHAPCASNTRGGGGGGATVAGATGAASGSGGAGATTSISATPTIYAGGGGAGSENFSAGAGGPGGGGTGGQYPSCTSTNGTINTGGGAGGGYSSNQNGGSGIVIIRYKFQ